MKVSAIVVAGSLLLSAGAMAQSVTDPQIAAIVVTANQVDIDAGKLAKSMASSGDVKKFAEQMITDHTGVNKSAVDLVTKLDPPDWGIGATVPSFLVAFGIASVVAVLSRRATPGAAPA